MSNCYLDGLDEYTVEKFSFDGNAFETSYRTYDASDCSGVSIDSGVYNGTFSVGDLVTTDSGLEAYEVDFALNYQGQIIDVKDLIRVEGNRFYYGESADVAERPTDLNFDVVLFKQ